MPMCGIIEEYCVVLCFNVWHCWRVLCGIVYPCVVLLRSIVWYCVPMCGIIGEFCAVLCTNALQCVVLLLDTIVLCSLARSDQETMRGWYMVNPAIGIIFSVGESE